jgi:uncharacterized protein YndB with AHSA1/START domain
VRVRKFREPPPKSLLFRQTLSSEQAGRKATKVTITHKQFTNTEDRDKHNEGWQGCLNRLQRILTTVA